MLRAIYNNPAQIKALSYKLIVDFGDYIFIKKTITQNQQANYLVFKVTCSCKIHGYSMLVAISN
jgi:hypothetical protein